MTSRTLQRTMLLGVCAVIAIAVPTPNSGRFLYVLNGGPELTKYDTLTSKRLLLYNLTTRTGALQLIPSGPGAVDGCLAYQAVYDPVASLFYTIVPEQYRLKTDGTKDYRVLSFTIPGIRFARQQPAGQNLTQEPHLVGVVHGHIEFQRSGDPPPQTELDISRLSPDKTQIGNAILERSGDSVLLSLYDAKPGQLGIAVANQKAGTLSRLPQLSEVLAARVHLAPGGAKVIVEQLNRLDLYDSKTGVRMESLKYENAQGSYFLAISPTGKVVYHSNEAFKFIDLGMKFPNVPVTGREQTCLSYFFADK